MISSLSITHPNFDNTSGITIQGKGKATDPAWRLLKYAILYWKQTDKNIHQYILKYVIDYWEANNGQYWQILTKGFFNGPGTTFKN